jgi:hypothetical protein
VPCPVFDGVKEFFAAQVYPLVFLVFIVFILSRTLGIGYFGFRFSILRVKFYRKILRFLYTFEPYFSPILLILLVL